MTIPVERTRALRVAGEVLTELLRAPNLTDEQRNQVRWALRHYPSSFEVQMLADHHARQCINGMPMLEPEPGGFNI